MRTPPLLADFSHARACKPFCENSLTLPYHLMMDGDYEDEIKQGLERKLEAMVRHEWYAKYKTAPTPEEREAARQRYLDERGVPQSFRWTTSPWER